MRTVVKVLRADGGRSLDDSVSIRVTQSSGLISARTRSAAVVAFMAARFRIFFREEGVRGLSP